MSENVIVTNNFRIFKIGFNYRQSHHGHTVLQHIAFLDIHACFGIFLPLDVQAQVSQTVGKLQQKL